MTRLDLRSARRLLAIRLDNQGDVVMLGPALRALRAAAPAARITLLCSPAGSLAAPLLPEVDDVLVRRVAWQDISGAFPQDPEAELDLIATLRGFDAAFVFTSFAQSPHPPAYACYLAGVPIRVGQSKEFGGALLSHAVPPAPDAAHGVDRNLHLLAGVGLPDDGRDLRLTVPHRAEQAARRLLDGLDRYAVLAPGASCTARRYPPERFAEVARQLSPVTPVVVVGSDRERSLLAPVRTVTGVTDLVGATTVPELAAVIRGADLVIANNSGPLHLADALRRPLLVLYSGAELVSQFEPRSTHARLLRRDTWCTPCYAFTCPYHLECLDIPPAEVVEAALDLKEEPHACAS